MAEAAKKVEKLRATDGPNKGAVYFSNQRYMIDERNKLWPYKKKQVDEKKYLNMRLYDPFSQGIPGFADLDDLREMSRDELMHYAEKKHPNTVKLYPDMPMRDMITAIRTREQKLVDMGQDPALRFRDMDDD